ncbi:MAG: YeeE/YedE family protein [Sneathiella sp.]|nr:YeeE/YedE family protein [Sneathiella sp.]
MLIFFLAPFLAVVIGFAAQRGGFCSVRAMEEILTTHRGYMLFSFLKVVLWVLGVSLLVDSVADTDFLFRSGWKISLPTVFGGILFGVGATINGGCAFSTLTRLGSGNLGMGLSLIGFAAGIYTIGAINPPAILMPQVESVTVLSKMGDLHLPITIFFVTWMCFEFIRIFLSSRTLKWKHRVLSPYYRLSGAAMLMGISNAVLYMTVGVWPYTGLLRQTVEFVAKGAPQPPVILWIMFLALIAGIGVSAWQSGRFHWQLRPQVQWISYILGGVFMGAGASVIPGGNDILLFYSAPSLSPHILPAFLSMFFSIIVSLLVMKALGTKIPPLNCSGDICKVAFDPPEEKD